MLSGQVVRANEVRSSTEQDLTKLSFKGMLRPLFLTKVAKCAEQTAEKQLKDGEYVYGTP